MSKAPNVHYRKGSHNNVYKNMRIPEKKRKTIQDLMEKIIKLYGKANIT